MSNSSVGPLVSSQTRTESMGIETVVSRYNSGRIYIPDYQRDAEQWDHRKESLFIESIINNLTIPAFFFATNEEKNSDVVDGQQRLTTILKFKNNELRLSEEDEVVYLAPQSVHYKGKTYDELPTAYKRAFDDYTLSIINLPENIELGTKLEIFRRINEGGTPLTAQDIRLSYYSTSDSVLVIRLAGLHSESEYMKRVAYAAERRGITNPWTAHENAWSLWVDWWTDKKLSNGQVPSEMFLWYLITREREHMNSLLSSADTMRHLSVGFRGATEEVLDIYCAQLQYTDLQGGIEVFPTLSSRLIEEFNSYAKWIEALLSSGTSGLSVDKYKQAALVIAALVELEVEPSIIFDKPDVWGHIAQFIRTPRTAGTNWLADGYPEPKGRWSGAKGQKAQCDSAIEIARKIIETHG
ncbi:DUF262 domain-containing protein [Vibrio parahaemolyticus]|nr:DUF262 domain-containing protein [Vibrio parahaemolyticus]EIA1566485.1 DUF262 domain-containing protein [Vibrio parahaemolyticus]EIU6867297.1 DUF262 domain-containing protein [Vibrio parahaemolyticus]EJE4694781.1 DUF262 domain-containing protein [Vibrio parahaemolyticus]MBM4879735.1 DUF262 domain-containing protein [Vibrio parahaemolyticus]